MLNFDWQTEEETAWEEETLATTQATAGPRPRRWPFLILVLVALGVAGAVIYRQVELRLQQTVEAIEVELLTTHNLVRQAERQGDVELFHTLLSGRDPRWADAQEQLVAEGTLLARPQFGLQGSTDPQRLDEVDHAATDQFKITLSPDLTTAELLFEEEYVVNAGNQVTETVVLRHMAIYRRGGQRWLLSPPLGEFWGEWQTRTGEYLTVIYPQRDEAIAVRLAADLDAVLDETCRTLADIRCPVNLRLTLRLDTDPNSLLKAADQKSVLRSGLRLELPSPTLVGRPLDDAAYDALYRGYAAHVVSAVVTRLVAYKCCQHGLFYQALLDKQLSQLEIRPWPLTPAVYEQLLYNNFDNLNADFFYLASLSTAEKNWQSVYALIDFLTDEVAPEMSLAEMQRQLNQEADYWGWLRTVVGDNYPNNNMVLATDWLDFAYRQTPSAQTGPPIPWPEQDIQLTCAASPGKALYQYDFATASWAQTFVHPQATDVRNALSSLPGRDGYLVQTASQIILWRNGQESVVYEEKLGNPRVWSFHVSGFDPTGRYLVMVAYIFGEEPMFEYRLIDLEGCDQNGCDFRPLPGRPIWSPDGAQVLFAVEPGNDVAAVDPMYRAWYFTLYHGDPRAESLVEVGTGNWPSWLDNERYSYSRLRSDEPDGKQELEVVIASVGDNAPQVVLRGADLLNAMPPAERPEQIYSLEAQELPTDKNRLLLTAFTAPSSSSRQLTEDPFYHFLLDMAADSASMEKIVLFFHSDTPSYFVSPPDGRWSAVVVPHDDGRIDSTIHLLNLESGQSITLSSSDLRSIGWSADGQWYLQGYERYLLLVAPGYEYQQLIPHDFLSCYNLRWVSNP